MRSELVDDFPLLIIWVLVSIRELEEIFWPKVFELGFLKRSVQCLLVVELGTIHEGGRLCHGVGDIEELNLFSRLHDWLVPESVEPNIEGGFRDPLTLGFINHSLGEDSS